MLTPTSLLNAIYFITASLMENNENAATAIATSSDCHANLGLNLTCIPSNQCDQNNTTAYASTNDYNVDENSQCMLLRSQLCQKSWNTIFITDASRDNNDVMNSHDLRSSGGSLVELYGEGSYFATPAIITGNYEKTTAMKYHFKHATTYARLTRVDPEFIHPYDVYEDGTEAHCNAVGVLTPCTIKSHSTKGNFILYQVSYVNEENEKVQRHLPFSKVQRVISD